jgi:cysteine peptidase C11 family protein
MDMPSAAASKGSSTTKAPEKQWTIMVYLAGDNNLDSAGVTDLKEMKKVGSTSQINLLAQFDRSGSSLTTKRYYLQKGTTLDKDAVANLGETDTGDPKVLESFARWGMKTYPAQHYLLVIWNHGAGWDDTDIYHEARSTLKLNIKRRDQLAAPARGAAQGEIPIRRLRVVGSKRFRRALFKTTIERAISPGQQNRAIAFDDTSKDFLDNIELKRVLASVTKTLGRKIDILGMDACLMSMAEVGYQLCDSVTLTVGSEEVEPGDGWPYDTVLAALSKKPQMAPQDLAGVIVKKYLASYDAQAGVTQAACDLAKAKTLAGTVDQLGQVLKSHLTDGSIATAILQARTQAQTYEVPDYIDLYDFCSLLQQQCARADVRAACQNVQAALSPNGYVIQSGFKGTSMQHSHGLSIYFPQKSISPLYATLDFTKQTSWDEFLRAYQNSTRRPR